MKRKVSSSLQDLIDTLVGPDYRASHEASCELIALGNKAAAALERALHQVPVKSQKHAIYTTLKDMRSAKAASVLLSQFSREPNDDFRAIIAEGLGLARCKKAGPLLEQALDSTQDERLSWAIQVALLHLGEREEQYRPYLSWLLERADDPDESIRVKAVKALEAFKVPAARSKLLEKLQADEDSAIKALAASSLTRYDLKDVWRPLEEIVETGDPEASLFASLALSHLQQVPLPFSVQELGAEIRRWPPQGRVAAIRVLSWFCPRESTAELLALLVDLLKTDNDLSIKREVVGMIRGYRAASTSTEATGAMAALQAAADGKEWNEVELLAAAALVKLGRRQYLDVVREHLIRAKEYAQNLSMFILIELDAELQNDFVPFLLDLAKRFPSPKVRTSAEFLLYGKYWRDPRLLPYFRECLAGKHQVNRLSLAQSLLRMSEEGYEPAYHLLKDFLGEEPSWKAIKRYFFWLSADDGPERCRW